AERGGRRRARSQPRRLPESRARRRARIPDAHRDPRGHRSQLRAAGVPRAGGQAMKYLLAAFNARPMGMPVPPNWFGLAAFGLLGALVNPGLWLVGLGLEGLYLWTLSRHERFRATVDAVAGVSDSTSRYETMLAQMDSESQAHQYDIEREAAEIVNLLQRS